MGIYPELVDAIKCVRAQGIKTALLTNNWLKEPGVGHAPVDKSLFDVVSHTINLFTDKFSAENFVGVMIFLHCPPPRLKSNIGKSVGNGIDRINLL